MKRIRAIPALALAALFAACASTEPAARRGPSPTPSGTPPAAAPSPSPVPSPTPEPPKRIPILLKESEYAAGGTLNRFTQQEWSTDLLSLMSRTTYDGYDSRPLVATTYKYDKGLLASETTKDVTGAASGRVAYAYNAKGQVSEEKRFDATDALLFISRYEYNDAGQRTAWRVFSVRNKLIGSTMYDYEDGLLKKMRMSDGDGKPGSSIVYEYDASGALLSRTYLRPDGSLEKSESVTYGPGTTKTEKTADEGGTLFTTTFEYERGTGSLFRKVVKNPLGAIKSWVVYSYAYREGGK